jgi:predicted nucleotide-binding protein (sugar kinase/HSP70/actin superfamily)
MGNIRIPLSGVFRALGAVPVVPPAPNRETIARGVLHSPEQMCIPFKYTLGNMIRALEMGADTLIYVGGSWSCRFGYYARLQPDILADLGFEFKTLVLRHDDYAAIAREILALGNGNPVRMVGRALQAARIAWLKSSLVDLAERLVRDYRPREQESGSANRAYRTCLERIDRTDSIPELARLRRSVRAEFAAIPAAPERNPLRLRVVGESFCLLEPVVNFDVLERLGRLGVWADPFLTTHRWLGFHGFRFGKAERLRLLKQARKYWRYNVGGEDENAVAYTIQAAEQGFDGVVHLHPFGCMPGTAVGPTLHQVSQDYGIPLLDVSLDEHTSESGFQTRLEAFVSVLEKRRRTGKRPFTGD